jgi:glycosyltransferase
VGYNTKYIPYEVNMREYGKPSWSFKKLLRYSIDGFTGYSVAPLKVASYLGIITSVIATIYFVITLLQKLIFGINVSGYATIVCLILLLEGVNDIIRGDRRVFIKNLYGG